MEEENKQAVIIRVSVSLLTFILTGRPTDHSEREVERDTDLREREREREREGER